MCFYFVFLFSCSLVWPYVSSGYAFHCCHRFDVLLCQVTLCYSRFVYDFCISNIDSESVHLAYSLFELVFVRSGSFRYSGTGKT